MAINSLSDFSSHHKRLPEAALQWWRTWPEGQAIYLHLWSMTRKPKTSWLVFISSHSFTSRTPWMWRMWGGPSSKNWCPLRDSAAGLKALLALSASDVVPFTWNWILRPWRHLWKSWSQLQPGWGLREIWINLYRTYIPKAGIPGCRYGGPMPSTTWRMEGVCWC